MHENDNIGKLYLVSDLLKKLYDLEDKNPLLEEAYQLNNSIISTIVPEQNEILLNNILINHYFDANEQLNQAAIDQLVAIANQDSRLGGISVSKARSILSNCFEFDQDEDDYIIENTITSYSSIENRNFKTIGLSESNLVEIYPIPVSDILNLNSNQSGRFKIFNTLGSEVFSGFFSDNNKFDVNALNSGIYFCEFHFANGEKTTKKIIVR